MEMILLWGFLIAGVSLLSIIVQKPPLKEWFLCFFIAAYFASILGELVVIYDLISYPVKPFPMFKPSILYEYLLLPLLSVSYYRTTHHRDIYSWLWQALVYSGVLTFFEILLEQNTDVVHYISWNWMFTLTSMFCFLMLIRYIIQLINNVVQKRKAK